ncbi:heme oxygenase-like protein [Microcella alkaliphila]|uniref:Heme oxygenase-like protein n=1 Tax=Microcella alkaliphila TaxID=279828 RepID=A0A4Q7TMD6_9MICO|nr:heme oxygenase-like protein [Microcella alkaliphila]
MTITAGARPQHDQGAPAAPDTHDDAGLSAAETPANAVVTRQPMRLPLPRGPVSAALFAVIGSPVGAPPIVSDLPEQIDRAVGASGDILVDGDLQLSLFVLYELHYGGIAGVDERWEWDPALLACRASIEVGFEAALRERVYVPTLPSGRDAETIAQTLFALTAEGDEPGLSHYVRTEATHEQVRELLIARSIYTLKEADPHSWAIPRLSGRAKSALVEVQSDEYGAGRADRMHAVLYARAMRGAGLETQYGHYLDQVDARILTSVNTMSLFGLHRRLRGAIAGHLAAFEMTSSLPNQRIAAGLRRLGYGDDVVDYFDEHVEADAVHEQIAGRDLAGGLVEAEPELAADVLFGAAACLAVDGWASEHMLAAWQEGRSGLRPAPRIHRATISVPKRRIPSTRRKTSRGE